MALLLLKFFVRRDVYYDLRFVESLQMSDHIFLLTLALARMWQHGYLSMVYASLLSPHVKRLLRFVHHFLLVCDYHRLDSVHQTIAAAEIHIKRL